MKITFLYFSYIEDENLIKYSILSNLLLSPDSKIVVADDCFNPCTENFSNWCKNLKVEYIQTNWPRFGNLRGPEHLKGYTELLKNLSKDTDIIIKIDCDTILLRYDWLDRFYNDTRATIAGSFKIQAPYVMGNCYAIKSSVCDYLYEDSKTYPAWHDCFEDYEIGIRLARQAKNDQTFALRYPSDRRYGFWLCTPQEVNIDEVMNSARVVSCGFIYNGLLPQDKTKHKQLQIEVMSKIYEKVKEYKIKPFLDNINNNPVKTIDDNK